nr:uncharacterized protein LOC107427727 [Ziziphus jujuba var. spinosa]
MVSRDVLIAQVPTQTPVFQVLPPANHIERPEKFDEAKFKRWQRKMLFYLSTLELARFLTEDVPPSDEKSNKETLMMIANELWETLDRKFKTENTGSEKFIVGRFLDYMMVDTKPLMSQLSLSWGDFRNYLKYKRKEMNIEVLVEKLQIEDNNRRSDKGSMKVVVKANVVEHGSSSKNKNKLGKSSNLRPKGGISKKAKFQGKCFNCGKMVHKAAEYRLPKRKRNKEAHMMEHITKKVDDIDFSTVVSGVNLVGSNPREWWIDAGVTRHVHADKNIFTSFKPKQNGEKLFMGNSATSEIQGEGKIVVKMIFRNDLTCNNVLYVLDISRI